MDDAEARRRFAAAPVARLATVDATGRPHLVPVTFAFAGDAVYTAVDAKPKTTTRLRRLANIAANPSVSLLVDHYDHDWTSLWWVRVDGTAQVVGAGSLFDEAIAALVGKYRQYALRSPAGPAIVVRVTRVRSWAASR
ncbi:MAG: TIGR03668 family PPOX class F420-dependent oxidoreductase [Streptosporangiales bacterium]|nr:TIGR03668 family PPOX class F420-dependent oxidoreductase [Streptosporangiales bacterium]MBO0889756.1 TIGR03668 family PPOX class F420-dependent oxidoreductase [Acidothermales bacterium]